MPSAHAIDREFKVQSALYGTEVPITKPLHYCASNEIVDAYLADVLDIGERERITLERSLLVSTPGTGALPPHAMVSGIVGPTDQTERANTRSMKPVGHMFRNLS